MSDAFSYFTSTETQVKEAAMAPTAKAGEVWGDLQFKSFFRSEGNATKEQHNIPDIEMKQKRDGTGDYPVKVGIFAIPQFISPVIGVCQAVDDQPGVYMWKHKVVPMDKTEEYLKSKAEWAHANKETDKEAAQIAKFVQPDGIVNQFIWQEVVIGSKTKFKVPGGKDAIIRKQIPGKNALQVQPGSIVKAYNLQPILYVGLRTEKDKDTKEETTHLWSSVTIDVTKIAVAPDSNQILCASEKYYASESRDKHRLMPISIYKATGQRSMPKQQYLFVGAYESPEGSIEGVSQRRMLLNSGEPERDFKLRLKDATDDTPTLVYVVQLMYWENDRPKAPLDPKKHRSYFVEIRMSPGDKNVASNCENIFRKFGITDLDSWVAIQKHNLDLPVHVEANLYPTGTLNAEMNNPKPGQEGQDPLFNGQYKFYMNLVQPDFLRHFRERGFEVSPDFVKNNFRKWKTTDDDNNSIFTLKVPPFASRPEKDRPLAPQGTPDDYLDWAVIPLGNGRTATDDPKDKVGINHAISGEITSLFDGGHRFYVLVGTVRTQDDIDRYAGGKAFCDEWLEQRVKLENAKYVIYAVRNDAKLIQPKAAPVVVKEEPRIAICPVSPKRESEEEKETESPVKKAKQESEEEEEEEDEE